MLLKTADRPAILWICHVAFLLQHCDHCFFHELGVMEFGFDDQVEELMHHKYSFSSALLISSALILLLFANFFF